MNIQNIAWDTKKETCNVKIAAFRGLKREKRDETAKVNCVCISVSANGLMTYRTRVVHSKDKSPKLPQVLHTEQIAQNP